MGWLRRRKRLTARGLVTVEGVTRRMRTPEERLDDLCRTLVFERDDYTCRRCRLPRHDLHPHHIVTRGKRSMRWDPGNILTLCSGCHLWWHRNSTEQERIEFLHRAIGRARADALFLRKRLRGARVDMEATRLWLEHELNERSPFPES